MRKYGKRKCDLGTGIIERIVIRMLLCICLAFSLSIFWGNETVVHASQIDFQAKVNALKAKFPKGKYWNHVGSAADNPDGYTDTPCTCHKREGYDCVYSPNGANGCTCNHFAGGGHWSATQCMGFANKLGYDVFGDTTWTTVSNPTAAQIADIRVGDIVRLSIGHSVFVISRVGDSVTVGEANYTNSMEKQYCQINWDRVVTLSTSTVSYYERAANYDAVMGNAASNTTASSTDTSQGNAEATTEAASTQAVQTAFTGWKQTADGQHFQYYEDGVLQKKQWIAVDGQDYYADKNGYILLSQWLYKGNTLVYVKSDGAVAKKEIVKINGKQYYFNSKGKRSKGFKNVNGTYYYCNSSGIIQKKKWITKSKKKYYVQKNGVRATNQLLKIGKHRYYFNEKGQLVKNKKVTYGESIYKANKNGYCKKVGTVSTCAK